MAAALAAALVAALAGNAWAAEAHVTRLGAASAGAPLQIVLPLKIDARALSSFALDVSNPSSSQYGRYESIAALARRFGASATNRRRVVGYLRAQGASAVKIDATGLLAQATVTTALAQRLFTTRLARFRTADGASFVAPSSGMSLMPTAAFALPPALRGLVDGVVGLDTRPLSPSTSWASRVRAGARSARRAGNPSRAAAAAAQPSSYRPRTGTPAGCPQGVSAGEVSSDPRSAGFSPNQYLTAYGFDPLQSAGVLGQGERVALVETDGFNSSDIDVFAQCFGLSVPPITVYGVDGISHPLAPGGEATLDLEVLDAAAPGLSGIDVYEAKNDPVSVLKALVAPLEVRGHKPQVVSASLGLCEQDQYAATGRSGIAAAERLLELATAAGVSYLAASGDRGSADCVDRSSSDKSPLRKLAVNYPASSWWVTGVGGTNLTLSAANQITDQIVWNDTTDQLTAAGGGESHLFYRPDYQKGFVHPNSRGVPDVSMLADLVPGYAIYCTAVSDCVSASNINPWLTVGGTSAATPLLAGGIALIDQRMHQRGRADVGFANPLLYLLGGSRARSSVFSDVLAIGNDVGPFLPGHGGGLGCCTARAGYDLASGLGSVDIANFAQHAAGLLPYILGSLKLSLPAHQHPAAHHQILATITCGRACYMGAFANVAIAHKSFTVDSAIVNRPSGGRRTLALKFSASRRHAISAALAKHQRVSATVYGVIVDPEGFIQAQTKGQRLTIKG